MLQSLFIRNYALISELKIEFPPHFSVLTGETGSGKSVIIGALSFLLGQRADMNIIKQGENRCILEGIFDLSSYHLQELFQEKNWEYDVHNCIIRREIWRSGKSRAFLNDTPVGLSDLKMLSSFLIDIHSQHQNLLLSDHHFQLQVLDLLAENQALRNEYTDAYTTFLSLSRQLEKLQTKSIAETKDQDYLLFQFRQLEAAHFTPDEQMKLERESEFLSHTKEIKSGLYRMEQELSKNEKGILIRLREISSTALSLNKMYPDLDEITIRIQSIYLELKDITREISRKQEGLEVYPEQLQQVSDRLDLIYSLQHKHQVNTVEELIELKNRLFKQLQQIQNYDEEKISLQNQRRHWQVKMMELAEKLTQTRKKASALLEKQLIKKANALGMTKIQFICRITDKPSPDAFGKDEVKYLFSTNKKDTPKAISQIASGGEVSRLMLGLKSLVARATTLPTIIFDEIDTGVSGEMADKMGKMMHQMGQNMQVITITHLPQIAAQGNCHFKVYRQEKVSSMEICIRRLSEGERIQEIACLLSGVKLTQAAIENAKELLQ